MNWKSVWEHIDARRIELGWSVGELVTHTGTSETTYSKMRRHGNPIKQPHRRSKIALALGWTPVSVERILEGGKPELKSEPLSGLHDAEEAMRRLGRRAAVDLDATALALGVSSPAGDDDVRDRVARLERLVLRLASQLEEVLESDEDLEELGQSVAR